MATQLLTQWLCLVMVAAELRCSTLPSNGGRGRPIASGAEPDRVTFRETLAILAPVVPEHPASSS